MAVKDDEIARLTAELATCEASIKNITETGQTFRKGGAMGFAVEQAKLATLRSERSELRSKIATWGLTDELF